MSENKLSDHEETQVAINVLKRLQIVMSNYPFNDVTVKLILSVLPDIIFTLEETYKIQLASKN